MSKLLLLIGLFSFMTVFSFGKEQPVSEQLKVLQEQVKQSPTNFTVIEQLAELHLYLSQYDEAIQLVNNYLQVAKPKGLNLARTYLIKGDVLKYLNETGNAYFFYMRAHNLSVENENWNLVVLSNSKLMELYRKMVKHKLGIELAKTTASLIKQHHVTDAKALNTYYNRYAALVNEQAQPLLSLAFSKKALYYADVLKDPNLKAISYNEMGFSYKNLMELDQAIASYEQAQKEWNEKGYFRESINAALNLVMVKAHNELIVLDEQIRQFKAVLGEAHRLGIHDHDATLHHYLSDSYGFKGDVKQQLHHFRIATNIELNSSHAQNVLSLKRAEEKYRNSQLNDRLKNEKTERILQEEQNRRATIMLWSVGVLSIITLVGFFYSMRLQRKIKRSYEEIKEKDAQKNMLIAEIHHRVKNNLQYVRSMLEMQLSIVSETGDKQNLEDVSRRIQAMSLVHEMLYNKEDSARIEVSAYLQQLFDQLTIGFSMENQPQVSIDIANHEMGVSDATSIGIICAELFNNSVKYAFSNHPAPEFEIRFQKSNGVMILDVQDNGESSQTPQSEGDESRQKLGLRIVDIFSRQLKATYIINREKGYHFQLTFEA